ncbi:MAG: FliA/WhiG family RNA polymerase sigma factor [Gemmatimonadetes bacterium]|nr:FliA/WhiG family RNA polymerase sigma factor [Gemmatimonadota bacterium]
MDAATLWTAYRRDGDESARERLLERHMPLVHHIARKILAALPEQAELGDLVSAGTIGLMNAIDTFEPDRGLAFSTFAAPRIRGAILDDLRRWDHAPRSVRWKQRRLNAAREQLTRTLDREPTAAELAQALGIDLEQLHRWESEADEVVQVALDEPIAGASRLGASPADVLVGTEADLIENDLNRAEEAEIMKRAIRRLPERERLVLALYYYEELKLHEIAEVLGLTESRISQIRSKALKSLRAELAPLREEVK